MNAISAAISQALVSLSADPLLIWNYGFVAVLSFVGGCLFYITHYRLDQEEDKLNNLETSEFLGRGPQAHDSKSDPEKLSS